MNETNVIEIGTNVKHTPLEYVYITIPAEYICVYHRILVMLADYGIDMLKDCKATCTDKNSGVIECFNMFNAAVAARKLANDNVESSYYKLSETLIKFIKAKINQIYKGKDNSTSFVFPVDENGELKAFVSCNDIPKFAISPKDGNLYEHKFHNGFDEHFALGPEDDHYYSTYDNGGLYVEFTPFYRTENDTRIPCSDVFVYYKGYQIEVTRDILTYYFDDNPVIRFDDVQNVTDGKHKFTVVVKYKDEVEVIEKEL